MSVPTTLPPASKGTVLVTGSSRGLGASIAWRLAEDGYDLVLHCRERIDEAQHLAARVESLGRQARVLAFDVRDRDRAARVLLADVASHGASYAVVCNAGVARDTTFAAMTGDEWDTVLQTNLDAFYNVLNPLLLPMVRRRQPGRIVTLSSVSGLVGQRGQVNYSAAKAGIIGATKALAVELARRGITCNCVAPGLIDAGLSHEALSAEARAMALAAIPMGREGTAAEVAGVVAFLLRPESAYITRQVIAVDGGLT